MNTLVLRRHYSANLRPSSTAEQMAGRRCDTQEGHPAIPAAAVPFLHRHVSGAQSASLPVLWHHRRGDAWEAVCDLHRAGDHDTAAALAALLTWTELHGSVADCTIWEIAAKDVA
jgi:hypothetical protein